MVTLTVAAGLGVVLHSSVLYLLIAWKLIRPSVLTDADWPEQRRMSSVAGLFRLDHLDRFRRPDQHAVVAFFRLVLDRLPCL